MDRSKVRMEETLSWREGGFPILWKKEASLSWERIPYRRGREFSLSWERIPYSEERGVPILGGGEDSLFWGGRGDGEVPLPSWGGSCHT